MAVRASFLLRRRRHVARLVSPTEEGAMKLKDLFGRKRDQEPAEQVSTTHAPTAKLDLDLLDDCVGGQSDTEGVGCYVRSTQPRIH